MSDLPETPEEGKAELERLFYTFRDSVDSFVGEPTGGNLDKVYENFRGFRRIHSALFFDRDGFADFGDVFYIESMRVVEKAGSLGETLSGYKSKLLTIERAASSTLWAEQRELPHRSRLHIIGLLGEEDCNRLRRKKGFRYSG